MKIFKKGFTLIELMVVVSIIALLSAVLYANFNDSRAQARDRERMTTLKEVQLALELYKAQNGNYPTGCSLTNFGTGPGVSVSGTYGFLGCGTMINGLVPDYISELPFDEKFAGEADRGYFYRSDGVSYKLMAHNTVETLTVVLGDEFARCPSLSGACASGIPANIYAVYSAGAENW